MKFNRRKTRQIQIGKVGIGSDFPISVQSMTTTKTKDVESTLSQIYELATNGADIVRVTCNEVDAATGLVEITQRSPVPIVADVHFQYKLALAAIDAGVNGLRLNPGNIRKEQQIKEVAKEALSANVPIRIGVNGGSLDKDLLEKYGDATPEALVESALKELKYLEDVGFFDIKISVKHSNVPLMIESYRLLAEKVDYPLHLGVTEAGPLPGGLIKSTAGIGTLLSEGIGDTIRYSLTTDPVEEAKSGRALLEYLGLRKRNSLDLIACPSCGRAEVDVIKVAEEAQDAIRVIDKAIEEVNSNRGEMGAFQKNNLESNLNYLRIAHENSVSSESVIRDADMAEEMTEFARNQILVQSSTAMLAQANQNSMTVLKLIG